ncbi:MAG TPA: hypothetical protein VF807_00590 [Ktedonobacterales bacterium]
MEELLGHISGQTGHSPDLLQSGLPIISGFLKNKLPPEAGSAIDGVLGQHPAVPGVQDVNDSQGLTTFLNQHTGIPAPVAALLVAGVLNVLKDRLPAPYNGMVGTLAGASAAGGILGELGNLFGKH